MGPVTKAATAKYLIGQPDSVLKPDFISAIETGNVDTDILPFSGPLQLPTSEAVLKLYFFFRNCAGSKNSTVSKNQVDSMVITQVIKYWTLAGYKDMLMKKQNITKKLDKEFGKYQTISKSRNKNTPLEVKKREEYLESILKIFDIASPDILEKLEKSRILSIDDECTRYRAKKGYTRKTEDVSFLLDQRGDRKMVMGEADTSYKSRVDKNNMKKQKNIGSSQAGCSSSTDTGVVVDENENMIENENDKDVMDTDFEYKGKHKKKNESVIVELPADIMNNPELCSMLDRTATSSRKAVGLVSSILKCGKIDGKQVDLNQFSLSRASLEKKRIHNRSVLMEQEMMDFDTNKPVHANLHWDGALMKDVTGKLQENEAILVSGAPHYLEGKILCVCKLTNADGEPTSTGEAQAEAVLEQIKAWSVDKNIVSLVYDTTASNSGVHRGATVRLQKALGRPVFFLACRHHMTELVVKACWYCLFEADLSPDCKFFADIKEEWDSLNISDQTEFITLSKDLQGRQEALAFYKELLMRKNKRNELTVRDDYRELAECAVLLLGETPPSGKIVWRKPGACHKARFCAFGIYSLKALAFAQQFDWDEDTITGLKQFCGFTTTIYIPHFLSSSIGCDATVNDLELFKKLFAYRSIDPQLAEESLVVLRRHGWYFSPEVAMFCLFSEKVSLDEKSRLAGKLLSLQSAIPESYKLEKPKFPMIDEKTKLLDLITPNSFKFFSILQLKMNWLAMNPERWPEDEHYMKAKNFVKTTKVTNDVAERGVKMARDYATILTKDDNIRDMLLQGVERCRRLFPDFKKQTLNS